MELQGVLVAVIGDDVNVRRSIRNLGLDADEPAGDMTAVKDPIHRVTSEDVGDLLLGGKDNQRRLQQAGADHGRRVRLGHGDGARRIRLQRMVIGSVARNGGGQRKSGGDDDGDKWFHGTGLSGLGIGYTVSP